MTKFYKNSKGFYIIQVDRNTMFTAINSPGMCDHCLEQPKDGYLVMVLNQWLCKDCLDRFLDRAKRYQQDISYEKNKLMLYLAQFEARGIQVEGKDEFFKSMK